MKTLYFKVLYVQFHFETKTTVFRNEITATEAEKTLFFVWIPGDDWLSQGDISAFQLYIGIN